MDQNNLYATNDFEAQKKVNQLADAAFSKCLAAAIMSQFPVASIIAIVFGHKGLCLVKDANEFAEKTGTNAGGKAIAAKILGMYGKIAGIVATAIYGLYFPILFFTVFMEMMYMW